MILPDLNLLLYAYNPQSRQHERASAWWENTISGTELIGLPHEVTLGFIRIATHPKLGKATVDLEAARDVVLTWLDLPQARVLLPSPDHSRKVINLMEATKASGSLASDASLAIYAMDNRATLYSNDTDFARFTGLDWENPI